MIDQDKKRKYEHQHQTNMNMKMDNNLNIATDNELSKRQVLALLMSMVLGVSIGWLGFLLFGDLAANSKVLYISQKEILNLEKERLRLEVTTNEKQKQQNLFFGQINQAIELIKLEAQKYQDKRTKVIFAADKFIAGEGVMSISRQVHKEVIEHLVKSIGNRNTIKLGEIKLENNNLEGTDIMIQPQLLNTEYNKKQYQLSNQ